MNQQGPPGLQEGACSPGFRWGVLVMYACDLLWREPGRALDSG
jgi:hypothetical protein